MITRRTALLVGVQLAPCAWVWGAGEFWNDKQVSDWTEKEISRLLTKSPWAKSVSPEIDFSGMEGPGGGGGGGGMPGGRGGGMGGPGMGGGGMGGPGMEGPGMGGRGSEGGPGPEGGGRSGRMTATVRWESAAPVREALKTKLSSDAEGKYVISVSGLPMAGGRGPRPGRPEGDANRPDDRRPDPLARMQSATRLERKGREPLTPSSISRSETDGTLLFYFAAGDDPISLDDKEVVFQTRLGPMDIKARFVPKEMLYHGKLALL
jgi:hypothetical protein